jgi:PPOX class probable F420-dependent enzyme
MERKTLEELPSWAAGLLDESRVAHLGLLDEDRRPRVLPVTFVVHAGSLWSAVDRKPKRDPAREPARVSFLRENPHAALTVDRYDDDWSRMAWVQVLGHVELLPVDREAGAVAALTAKYPQYERDPPPGPVLRLQPRRVLCWSATSPG